MSADDWAAAALTAIREGGLAAVAVEPLATRLGATKGSFYWHFPNRDALITAALTRWEQVHTEAVIAGLEQNPDPAERLRALFRAVLGAAERGTVELALLATAEHPLVAPALARVTDRRVGYVAELFAELGLSPAEARRRALLAFSAYLGHAQLAHATPQVLPSGPDAQRRYLDHVIETLLPAAG